jgi:hypothetical protein
MALEIRYTKRAAPRVRTRQTQAGVAARKLKVFQGSARPAEAVLDLSLSGIKMVVRGEPFEKGEKLVIELVHPSFRGAVPLDGLVRWSRSEPPGADRCVTGVEFVDLDERRKRQLDRVLALELGSNVMIAGHGHVGWAARGAKELASTVFVYDLDRHELGRVLEEKEGWRATRIKAGQVESRQSADLGDVLRWVFSKGEGGIELNPPLS